MVVTGRPMTLRLKEISVEMVRSMTKDCDTTTRDSGNTGSLARSRIF